MSGPVILGMLLNTKCCKDVVNTKYIARNGMTLGTFENKVLECKHVSKHMYVCFFTTCLGSKHHVSYLVNTGDQLSIFPAYDHTHS